LRDRLATRVGDDGLAGYDVRTFHSLGFALYRDGWARDYDNRPRVRVATRAQAQQAAVDAARAVGLDLTPYQAARLVADAKLGLPLRCADPALVDAALAVHDDLLARRDLLHIHDLLVRPVRLLAEVPALRRELRARYCCVVGDEAQDWSPYQAALFAYLAGPEGYATACGDPRQSIFGGSSPRFLLEFPAVYPQTHVVTLHTTYRLTGPLLALSRAIATHLPGGAIIGLCQRSDGPLPLVHVARTRADEATWIAAYLRDLHARGLLDHWGEAVVLVRTRRQRTRLVAALRAAGLAVHSGDRRLVQRPIVSALMAWLTLLHDPEDSGAVLGALDAPPRGTQRTPRSLRLALAHFGPWTMDHLCREEPLGLSDWQRRELGAFVRLYQGLRSLAEIMEPVVLFDAILERTGVAAWLHATTTDVTGDISALRALVEQEGDIGALDHALAEEPSDDADNAVAVHTIHGFKGREARAVVVAGVEEGLLPHPAVLRDGPAGLEEELRTFYVACTRACTHEAITAAWEPDPGQGAGGPSRLFHLIDPTLVKVAWPDRAKEIAMLIPQSEIDRIKREVSVEQFLVNPKRQGGFLVARCPLPGHDDKTPSFRFNLAEGWWKCMGCGRGGGDVIKFACAYWGLSWPHDFPLALERLGARRGDPDERRYLPPRIKGTAATPIRPETWPRLPDRTAIAIYRAAAEVWATNLWRPTNRDALAYVRGCGILDALIRSEWIGVSTDTLGAALRERDLSPEVAHSLGLLRRDGHETFAGRITFVEWRLVAGEWAPVWATARVYGDGAAWDQERKYFNVRGDRLVVGLDHAR